MLVLVLLFQPSGISCLGARSGDIESSKFRLESVQNHLESFNQELCGLLSGA